MALRIGLGAALFALTACSGLDFEDYAQRQIAAKLDTRILVNRRLGDVVGLR